MLPKYYYYVNILFSFHSCRHDISTEDWSLENRTNEESKQESIARKHLEQNLVAKINLSRHKEQNQSYRDAKIAHLKNRSLHESTKLPNDDSLNENNPLFEDENISALDDSIQPGQQASRPSVPLFEISPDEDDNNDDDANLKDSITLMVNNYEHWLCMGHQLEMIKPNFESLCKKLPLNFQWMLHQCAHVVQCHERDVYQEMQVIENQYAYVLESFGCMTDSLVYKLPTKGERVPGMGKLSNTLRKYW